MENVLDNVIDSELTGNDPGAIETPEGKTFSQEDVNKIINERLKKEKEKSQKQFETMEKEFQQKELNLKAKEILTAKNIPHELLDVLKYDDEATLNKAVGVIESSFKTGQSDVRIEGIAAAGNSNSNSTAKSNDDLIRKAMGIKK